MTVGQGSLQAVVMAAGKGSRMTDLTCTKAKCLLPVAGMPMVWWPLNMLQTNGFTEAIVIVPDSAKNEVLRLPERCGLSLRLDVVGVSGQEDIGTADSLRLVADKLTGADVLVVSGDLVMEESLRGLVDLHRMKGAALTSLLARNTIDMKTVIVPGDKKSKYKRERDLIGLSGDTHLCLFTAEADVEEDEVRMGAKMMRSVGAFTVNTNLLDGHLYIMRRWVCDYIISDRNISTIKGELLPIIVKKQFSRPSSNKEEMQEKRTIQSFVETGHKLASDRDKMLYSCHAYITESPCYRVNTMPAYWHCNSVLRKPENRIHSEVSLGDKAQLASCQVSSGCSIADKTTLTGVSLGLGVTISEKVRITNSVLMDGVTVMPGSVIEDSILGDGVKVGEKCSVKMSVLGRGQSLDTGAQVASQLLLDKDRMMEV